MEFLSKTNLKTLSYGSLRVPFQINHTAGRHRRPIPADPLPPRGSEQAVEAVGGKKAAIESGTAAFWSVIRHFLSIWVIFLIGQKPPLTRRKKFHSQNLTCQSLSHRLTPLLIYEEDDRTGCGLYRDDSVVPYTNPSAVVKQIEPFS
ncbi:hypothetical protein CRG98_017370 [Punica granatum]|uniref:Uncharacterized protein n=1 Tax=Punica granatum TaxID=22663 RepID=A0A2I0K3F4_PUNGR|nr:hypothetical protein CRG98_017370 [Punica granatum]